MGMVSRAIDKLPLRGQVVLTVLTIVGGIYYIAHFGFFTFLVHLIFSPNL
jgi:hypothetical protein